MKLFLSLTALFLLPLSLFAKWDKVAQMTESVGCGFFFDKNSGLIGGGQFTSGSTSLDPLKIWWTTDGGSTWTQSTTPSGTGRVTNICMKDALVGYASIYSSSYSLWKTTDGGRTWKDITGTEIGNSVCVFATPQSLVKTMWGDRGFRPRWRSGGFSTNDGASFTSVFYQQFNEEWVNGIDFADDKIGVVSPGPQAGTQCFMTSDGGLTWRRGGDIDEAWGVYAVKGTQTFFTAPEGDAMNPTNTLRISIDAGSTWSSIHTFNNRNLTGHIAGMGSSIYVQTTTSGIYRSDDLGNTWKSVAGPSGERDTRFVVTGCRGEVVYAFDNSGGVWRTTDGGDGTLLGMRAGPILTYSPDTVKISTFYCQPERAYVDLVNTQCYPVTIDTVFIESGINEFFVDTINVSSVTDLIPLHLPIRFQYNSSAVRSGTLRVKGHIGDRMIDTLVPLIGKNATAPEPFIGTIPKVYVGDTTVISVFLKPTVDTFTISRYTLHLSYNTDILSPIDFSIKNTLSTPILNASISRDGNGMTFFCQMRNPIHETNDLTVPLISFLMQTYISKETGTNVRLDTFSVTSLSPLPLCNVPVQPFGFVEKECGDTLLSDLMRYGKITSFNYIHPNPARENELEAGFELAEDDVVALAITDINGITVAMPLQERTMKKGLYTEHINIVSLANGVYSLVLKTSRSMVTRKLIIAR
jgi:photosystem II stability/assembly factor-like uncharacterized protein